MLITKLNLKECDDRKFNRRTGDIFCKKHELYKTVEDCLECMAKNNNCNESMMYTQRQVEQIANRLENKVKKAEKQRDINLVLAVLVLVCWILFELYDKIV